jgi:hypothetical protein
MQQDPRIEALGNALRPLQERLVTHEVYTSIKTLRDVAIFMEHHVFAVWDFMSLLKSLQGLLTCVSVPWIPRGDRTSRRLINELVLGEESDEATGSSFISHYELYSDAMVECGADTATIDDFIARLSRGEPVREALRGCRAPVTAQAFVETTWGVIEAASPPCLAAAFAFGREEIIPDMFRQIIANLQRQFPGRLTTWQTYLDRHVHLDEDRHGPLARQMLAHLCGESAARWREAQTVAETCLQARIALWDGVVRQIAYAKQI